MDMKQSDTHRKIRILAIAPYEGMKTLMESMASKRDDIELDVFVGDLEEGLAIAKRSFHNNYDVILSRGGTAELISKEVPLPVVEAELSVYDILRAIKLSENYGSRYAVVGFSGITSGAQVLCDLLQYHIDIFTIHHSDEVEQTILQIRSQGYQMVLCDNIANNTARRLGLNTILITSGPESITDAFDRAVRQTRDTIRITEEKNFYQDILRTGHDQTVVLREDGELFFSSSTEDLPAELKDIMVKELPAILTKKTAKFFRNINGALYAFTCRDAYFLDNHYAVFYFSSVTVPFATSKYGIRYSTLQETEDTFFNSFYGYFSSADIQKTIDNAAATSLPVMLSGEAGSGKEHAAQLLYSRSQERTSPLITIDCSLINERSWNFLTNNYNSPFMDNGNTIYFKDLMELSPSHRRQLLSIILDTNLKKRCRLIFSCDCPMNQPLPHDAQEFVTQLSCLTIHLPPLRTFPEQIPALAALYLNTVNVSTASQVIGLEKEALELLQAYSWPANFTQFKGILNELVLMTSGSYITKESVASLLEGQPNLTSIESSQKAEVRDDSASAKTTYRLDLTQPLNVIIREVIENVLDDCNGNQSKAAKQLGIGRTTLWRYLKD